MTSPDFINFTHDNRTIRVYFLFNIVNAFSEKLFELVCVISNYISIYRERREMESGKKCIKTTTRHYTRRL